VLFFVAVAMLFPFAVGPDAKLLARTGAGVVWIAALLAAILPLDRLIEPDLEAGLFDQWALRGIAEEAVLAARILAHWLSFGPPLMLGDVCCRGVARARRGAALRGSSSGCSRHAGPGGDRGDDRRADRGLARRAALGGLLVLPLAVPLLIFGAGSLQPGGEGGLALCAAAASARWRSRRSRAARRCARCANELADSEQSLNLRPCRA
jgi:heme exporter protein B